MDSSHPTVLRIRLAMQKRGISSYEMLSSLTGMRKQFLRKLVGDRRIEPDPKQIKTIAERLCVDAEWLSKGADAKAPKWAIGVPLPKPRRWEEIKQERAVAHLPRPPRPPPAATEDGIAGWRFILNRTWFAYTAQSRCPPGDKLAALITKPTAAGEPWRRYHRSIAVSSITEHLTPAEQHGIAQLLDVPGTPDYASYAAWVAQQPVLQRGAYPDLSLVWPLEPEGRCYQALKSELSKAKKGRLINKPIASDPYGKTVSIDELGFAMRSIFQHRFFDDPLLDLTEAVAEYRAIRKFYEINARELREHPPELDAGVDEFWNVVPAGHLIPIADLKVWYERFGLHVDKLDAHLKDREKKRILLRKYWDTGDWIWVYDPTERPEPPTKPDAKTP